MDLALFPNVLSSLGLLFEVVAVVDVFDDPLILVFDVLDLLLEVLELEVQGLNLLGTADVAGFVDGLRGCRVAAGVELGGVALHALLLH